MRTRFFVLTCLLASFASTLAAQSEKDLQKVFEGSVLQQKLYLRNFSAEDIVQARWNGSSVEFDPPFAHILTALFIDSVAFPANRVEFAGRRASRVWDRQVGYTSGPPDTPVRLVVDLGGGDRKPALLALRDALFFPSESDALATVPRSQGGTGRPDPNVYTQFASLHVMAENSAPNPNQCDCADKGTEACGRRAPVLSLTGPRPRHMVDPQFSPEARQAKQGGNVVLSLVVDGDGQAIDLWITKPLGFGLNRKAVEAVQQYDFQPATCHERHVKAALNISVNFQIF